MDSNQKGSFLEDAVESIEKMILTEIHEDKIEDIDVTKRKIIIHKGVKYEIDIYAKVMMKKGYDSIFVFECKNWDSVTIPPKEIYYFDRKIQITNAQKGFFVGTKFTESAINMGILLPRVELVTITKHTGKRSAPFVMFSLNHTETNIHELRCTSDQGNQFDIIADSFEMIYNGNKKDLDFMKGVLVQKLMKKIDSGCHLRHLEIYCEDVSDNIDLSDIDLIVNGEKITSAFIKSTVCLDVSGNKSVSFDVQVGDRGRYTVITKESKGGTCDIGFTISLTTTD